MFHNKVKHFEAKKLTGIAYDENLLAKFFSSVGYEHDVLVPAHQMTLPRGSSNDQSICTVLDLQSYHSVIRLQIKFPIALVRRFDCCYDSC